MKFINDISKHKIWRYDESLSQNEANFEELYVPIFWLSANKKIMGKKDMKKRKLALYKYLKTNSIEYLKELEKFVDEDRNILFKNIKFDMEGNKKEKLNLPKASPDDFLGYFSEDLESNGIVW